MPTCAVCRKDKANSDFTKNQAQKARANKHGVCLACQNAEDSISETTLRVSSLTLEKSPQNAPAAQRSSASGCFSEVESLKTEGNTLFEAGKFKEAVARYERACHKLRPTLGASLLPEAQRTQAVELLATLHANASQCYLNLKQFKLAQDQASECLRHVPTHEKALLRYANASEQLREWHAAIVNLEMAMTVNPSLSRVYQATLEKLKRRCAKDEETSKSSFVAGGMHQDRPHPAGWALGLPKEKQYEWFVDCYRMRVDDDYCWGGGHLHGLYNVDGASAGSVVVDFLLFCKLAVARGAVPTPWSWSKCLDVAAKLLMYAFEKSDAQEKWGSENFFFTQTGGRSLRCAAQLVYGESCQSGIFSDGPEDDLRSAMEVEIERKLGDSPLPEDFKGKVLADVGGDKIWRRLCQNLVPHLGLGDVSDFDDDFDDGFDEEEEEDEAGEDEEEDGVESDTESLAIDGTAGASAPAEERGGRSGASPVTTPASGAVQHSCAHCGQKGEPPVKLEKCSRCLTVRYCSKKCQTSNWKAHKKICRAPQLVA